MLLEVPCFYYAPLVIIFDLIFVFGICKLLAAMADDVNAELQSLNEQREFHKSIHKFIELHSSIKQLSEHRIQIYKCKLLEITLAKSDRL